MNGKKSEKKTIIALAAVLLLMAVSFAVFTTTLYIGGNGANSTASVTVNTTSWSVRYDNTTLNEVPSATSSTLTDTDYTFTVQLDEPGDKFTATWDVVNDGNFDAVLNEINMSTLTAAQQLYLDYSITYKGTKYTSSNTGLALDLEVGDSETITLELEYKMPENANELPTTPQTISVSGNFVYNQKTS